MCIFSQNCLYLGANGYFRKILIVFVISSNIMTLLSTRERETTSSPLFPIFAKDGSGSLCVICNGLIYPYKKIIIKNVVFYKSHFFVEAYPNYKPNIYQNWFSCDMSFTIKKNNNKKNNHFYSID